MADQNRIAQMLEVLADNGFGMYDLSLLMRSINEGVIQKSEKQKEDDERLETRIIEILDDIPIVYMQGYELLVKGIKLAYKHKQATGKPISYIEKKLANVTGLSYQVVVRMMKTVLEGSWRSVDAEVAKKYGVYRNYKIKSCDTGEMCSPSNGMFVTAIADYLIKEEHKKVE